MHAASAEYILICLVVVSMRRHEVVDRESLDQKYRHAAHHSLSRTSNFAGVKVTFDPQNVKVKVGSVRLNTLCEGMGSNKEGCEKDVETKEGYSNDAKHHREGCPPEVPSW